MYSSGKGAHTWVIVGVSMVKSDRTPRMARVEKRAMERTVVNMSVSSWTREWKCEAIKPGIESQEEEGRPVKEGCDEEEGPRVRQLRPVQVVDRRDGCSHNKHTAAQQSTMPHISHY